MNQEQRFSEASRTGRDWSCRQSWVDQFVMDRDNVVVVEALTLGNNQFLPVFALVVQERCSSSEIGWASHSQMQVCGGILNMQSVLCVNVWWAGGNFKLISIWNGQMPLFSSFTKKTSYSRHRDRIRGYEPLHSDNSKVLDAPQTLGGTREKPKDETKTRIRKKVRFNLEVVTYEPLSSQEDDHDDNNWEERGDEKTDQATAAVEACLICAPLSKTISTESKLPFSATNARLRSHYIVPVLNPIENLSQWKTVKTRKC
uniref:Uncharacterized protein n=1 Tax=Chenopodium quinoa TaxID=63459 RepID=A0A803KT22_CHEQI